MAANSKRGSNHENGITRKCQNRQRSQGVYAGMCERVYLVHHKRSIGKMSTRKAENCKWRGHLIRHDIAGFRKLRRGTQNIPGQISRIAISEEPVRGGAEGEQWPNNSRLINNWVRRCIFRRRRRVQCTILRGCPIICTRSIRSRCIINITPISTRSQLQTRELKPDVDTTPRIRRAAGTIRKRVRPGRREWRGLLGRGTAGQRWPIYRSGTVRRKVKGKRRRWGRDEYHGRICIAVDCSHSLSPVCPVSSILPTDRKRERICRSRILCLGRGVSTRNSDRDWLSNMGGYCAL